MVWEQRTESCLKQLYHWKKQEKYRLWPLTKQEPLTYGKLKIAQLINYSDIKNEKLLQLIGSIEAKSTHPIGKAFTDYFGRK